MVLGIAVQAPSFRALFTHVSMKAMPAQPSSTFAYFDPA